MGVVSNLRGARGGFYLATPVAPVPAVPVALLAPLILALHDGALRVVRTRAGGER